MPQLFADNATAALAAALTAGATSLTVSSGQGARFPTPSGGDFFEVTLIERTNGVESAWENITVTARAGDVFTITRGFGARAWVADTPLQLRWNTAAVARLRNQIGTAGTSNAATTGTIGRVLTQAATMATHTLTGNTTFSQPTFDAAMTARLAAGGVIELDIDLRQSATAYTLTYWSGIDWRTAGATAAPAPAAGKRVEHILTYSTAQGWVGRVGATT